MEGGRRKENGGNDAVGKRLLLRESVVDNDLFLTPGMESGEKWFSLIPVQIINKGLISSRTYLRPINLHSTFPQVRRLLRGKNMMCFCD